MPTTTVSEIQADAAGAVVWGFFWHTSSSAEHHLNSTVLMLTMSNLDQSVIFYWRP